MVSETDVLHYALIGLEGLRYNIKMEGGDMHETPEKLRDRAKRLEKVENDYKELCERNREL